MSQVTVRIDRNSDFLCEVSLRSSVPMKVLRDELLQALHNAEKIKLNLLDDQERPITYHIVHRGREIAPEETLQQVGVQDGDTLTLFSTAIAGSAAIGGAGGG